MRDSLFIYKRANEIVKETQTRNPFEVAKRLGLKVYYNDEFTNLLGFYSIITKKRAVVINTRLEEYMARMVMAHEIGHDTLHQEIAQQGVMEEFTLFNVKNDTEYEANMFAAHLLLDTDEILEYAKEELNFVSIASINCVNVNLVLIKISEMIKLGYDLRMPSDIKKDFLKDIKV